ncbi:MAG: type VI secretion system tube protein TssD [Hydrogenophaga sp.]|uniref:type VI secretion system tube protein TssD n=1 Tax=Hydrogenophaga sp. TaxID=1904254 RepID=UPI003D13E6E1
MADTIALTLTANGDAVEGDSTVTAMDRADTIEVLSLEQQVSTAFDRATLLATGRRIYAPIRFTKRMDRATPLLRQALAQNQVVEGSFRWFRPNPAGTGAVQHCFTLDFTGGRVTKCALRLPDTLDATAASLPLLEEVELTFSTITWTWVPGGTSFEDTWGATT